MRLIIIFSLITALYTSSARAQEKIQPDNRLFSRFTKEYVDELLEKNPAIVEYLNFTLDNSWYIINGYDLKQENFPVLMRTSPDKAIIEESTEIPADGVINIMEYDIQLNFSQRSYYRLGRGGQVIVFYSLQEIADKYNQARSQNR